MVTIFLKKFWREIVIALLVLSLAGAGKAYVGISNEFAVCDNNLNDQKETTQRYRKQIDKQNSEIDKLGVEADKYRRRINKLMGEIINLSENHKRELGNLNKQVVPKQCDNAMEWMIQKAQKELVR